MNRFIFSLSIMVTSFTAFAQKQYFIYLQSDPEQLFFIKLNEKIHNSTSSGYLILSRLKDTVYNFTVGFPQNKWPEQKFSIELKAKDRGFLLKNFGEKGWGLYDLQTSATQMSTSVAPGSAQKTEQREVSAFTEILSKASNDPSLKERPLSPPVTPKENTEITNVTQVKKIEEPVVTSKEETPAVKKNDLPLTNKEDVPAKKEEVKPMITEEYKRSVVTKKSEASTSDGLGLTFVDDYGNGTMDTIVIFIPNQRSNLAENKETVKEEKQFLDINNNANESGHTGNDTIKKADTVEKKTEKAGKPVIPKLNCSGTATEADFLKLRKKMAAETNDEAMTEAAKKYFKTKCFSTAQVKNLGTLFLNDNGKYKFFDAAYPYVSDPDKFPSLQDDLKDEYYINRFKAMLR